jgi:glutathione peroxidase
MGIRDIKLTTIDGERTSLRAFGESTLLLVNVASKCGNTPQYEQLEQLQQTYGGRGFSVIGFPCNQFLGQEPGTAADIKEFCSTTYGVTFPLMAKVRVNGIRKHPLYNRLTRVPDAKGKAGKVTWNFEKYVLAPDDTITRFRHKVKPDDPAIVAAIEAGLAQSTGSTASVS